MTLPLPKPMVLPLAPKPRPKGQRHHAVPNFSSLASKAPLVGGGREVEPRAKPLPMAPSLPVYSLTPDPWTEEWDII